MRINAEEIRLVTEKVGNMFLVTSPDVPELHVAHADEATALAAVQSTLDMIARMEERIAARKAMREVQKERACA